MLRSDLCDYSDAYAFVKGIINIKITANTDIDWRDVAFKINASFRSCIGKINSTLAENAEDLNIVIPMYNVLEYSQTYSMIWGTLYNYYRDKINVDTNASDSKWFKYKTKIIWKTGKTCLTWIWRGWR